MKPETRLELIALAVPGRIRALKLSNIELADALVCFCGEKPGSAKVRLEALRAAVLSFPRTADLGKLLDRAQKFAIYAMNEGKPSMEAKTEIPVTTTADAPAPVPSRPSTEDVKTAEPNPLKSDGTP